MKWKELFGSYDGLERASKYPEKVRKLRLSLIPGLDKEEALFTKFTNIKELYIQTAIDSEPFLPQTIGSLTSLKKLMILNVPFVNFPQWLFNLKNLEYLMVRGHDITQIPLGIVALDKLKVLRLENCALKVLPDDLRQLKALEELSVVDCAVEISPELLPIGLKRLDRTFHDISILKEKLTSLPNLEIT